MNPLYLCISYEKEGDDVLTLTLKQWRLYCKNVSQINFYFNILDLFVSI